MKTIKKLGLVSAVAFAMLAFSACDDDSSSPVKPEPEVSSEADDVESSSSVEGKSEEKGSSAKDAESSSSVKDNALSSGTRSNSSLASSSSAVPENPESSSSAKSGSNSAKSSSSSVKSSSSFTSSSSTKPENPASSSSAKSSSSSIPVSSSEYIPYNHAGPLLADSLNSNAYQKFSDSRNGRSYYYLTINGKDGASVTVMAENLNIGEMVNGGKDQTNDSKIERYCYDNDTTKCDKYGGLYQWAEMMNLPFECNSKSCADSIKPNHQGICPNGWRLLTYDDLVVILKADGNEHGIEGARAQGFGGYNTTGYSLVGAGYNWNYGFKNIGEAVYWFYPEEDADSPATKASDSFTGQSLNSFAKYSTKKIHGFSVRCVKSK
ncbi:major paralogous domain-containing protein [Fibrobacter sp. UWOV1]|uniref:FISUMP domain-containing protein n=1 Tax=Fibrobacter sp. UWOV1 TaxID=1896215 RepID=UPI0009192A74|nr:FISUMP domain-containing protein [Fibrobacter sp. UWOV1]SHL84407.1 major paralogous domain-containing protein [Fibrobacter sp. UWOV1]